MRARGRRRAGRTGARGIALAALVGCASGPPPAPPLPEWSEARSRAATALESRLAQEPAPVGGLELRLAFAADVDLDLYVTDPRLETLYYANTPVRSGGELLADRRCDGEPDDAAQVEVARFPEPPPGRYRVGVDFPAHCGGGAAVAPFALAIEGGGVRRSLRGLAEHLRFQSLVVEFDWPGAADERRPGD